MKKYNVTIIAATLGLGGTEQYTLQIANHLSRQGHNVTILLTEVADGVFKELISDDVSIVSVKPRNLAGYLAYKKNDRILINNCHGTMGVLPHIKNHTNAKITLFTHGISSWTMGLFKEKSMSALSSIYTVSPKYIPILKDRLAGWKGRFGYFTFPIDTNRFFPTSRKCIPNSFGWPNDSVVLVYAGRFSGEKRLDLFLKIFHEVKKDAKKARLLIIGGADEKVPHNITYWKGNMARCKKIIEHCGLSRHVHITGVAMKPEDYLQLGDIYCISSTMEGLPIAMLEAMGCGMPVVTTPVGDYEMISENHTGLVVGTSSERWKKRHTEAYKKALLFFINEASMRNKAGRNARKHICENYNIENFDRLITDWLIGNS